MRDGLKTFGEFIVKKPKNLVLFLLAAMTLSASIFVYGPVLAAGEAKWSDDKFSGISYDGNVFRKLSDSEKKKLPNEVNSGNVYVYEGSLNASTSEVPIKIIVADKQEDPSTAKLYNYTLDTVGKYTENSSSEDLEVSGVSEESSSSCSISGGFGWAVCMIGSGIAWAIDASYSAIEQFLAVKPLVTDSENPIYRVWEIMRDIANILFAIFFIFVIYSQITGIGISNYGIKKILPKLIVSAVLINISYLICAILVDVSNILGNQLQNLLIEVRKQTMGDIKFNVSWTTMVQALFSGGAAWYVAPTIMAAASTSFTGIIIPLAIGAVFAVFIALVILAARQAIIIILIFLAPLAFAARILPNTEKWYEKWKDTFSTMLIMYPLFSLLFGGSQLAGMIIMASSGNNLIMLLLGFVVMFVPLAVTPFLMKISGGLLGKIGGMVNDPTKGPLDTLKNHYKDRGAASLAKKNNAKLDNFKQLNDKAAAGDKRAQRALNNKVRNRYARALNSKYQTAQNTSRWGNANNSIMQAVDSGVQNTLADKQQGSSYAEYVSKDIASGATDALNATINRVAATTGTKANLAKIALTASNYDFKISENKLKEAINKETSTIGSGLYGKNADFKTSELQLQASESILNKQWEGMKAESLKREGLEGSVAKNIRDAMISKNTNDTATKFNQAYSTSEYTKMLIKDEDLRNSSAGLYGKQGAMSVLSAALAASKEEFQKDVKAAVNTISEFNSVLDTKTGNFKQLTKPDMVDLVLKGGTHTIKDINGNKIKINTSDDKATIEALLMDGLKGSPIDKFEEIIVRSGNDLRSHAATISSAIGDRKSDFGYATGGNLNNIATGGVNNIQILNTMKLAAATEKGKINGKSWLNMDPDEVKSYIKLFESPIGKDYLSKKTPDGKDAKKAIIDSIREAYKDPRVKNDVTEEKRGSINKLLSSFNEKEL